jgi:hypothetical protein
LQSGEDELDNWLRQRALDNAIKSASTTYVICPKDSNNVIGYYALNLNLEVWLCLTWQAKLALRCSAY